MRYTQVNTKVRIHLDPFDCVVKVITLDASYLHGTASRLRDLNPVSLKVFIVGYEEWDQVRCSSLYHYLIGMCESLRIKLIIELKPVKRRTMHETVRTRTQYVLDYRTDGYKAKLAKLVDKYS
jgi:hypothetical protein